MSLSTHKTKFLLDENVRIELFHFLQDKGYDAVCARKQSTDKELAQLSLQEDRVLVTNDEDFSYYSKSEIFAVVWLRIPQADSRALHDAFVMLMGECDDFSDKLIILETDEWRAVLLGKVESL